MASPEIANINLTGISKFGTRCSADFDNSAPTWSINLNSQLICHYASEANKPKLDVTWTPAVRGYAFFMIAKTKEYEQNYIKNKPCNRSSCN